MRRIRRTARADADLQEIWQYIALDSEAAADRVARAIIGRIAQLSANPALGPRRDDVQPGLRHLIAGAYLIFYRQHADEVEIVRILHGSRSHDEEDMG